MRKLLIYSFIYVLNLHLVGCGSSSNKDKETTSEEILTKVGKWKMIKLEHEYYLY